MTALVPAAGPQPFKMAIPEGYRGQLRFPSGLSPSSLNAYLDCQVRWAYDKIFRIPGASGEAALAGLHMHRVLEVTMGLRPPGRTLDNALDIHRETFDRCHQIARTLQPSWQPVHPELLDIDAVREAAGAYANDGHTMRWVADLLTVCPDMAEMEARALNGVHTYFAMSNDPNEVAVVAIEQSMSGTWQTPSGPVPVRGVIDRIDRLPTGRLHVLDYKNGAAANPRFDDGGYRRQLLFYAAMCLDHYGELPQVGTLLYFGSSSYKRYAFDLDEVEKFRNWVGEIWADMQARYRNRLSFEPNTGPLCGWCPYVALCPAGEAEVRRRAAKGTGKGGMREDAPAREMLNLAA